MRQPLARSVAAERDAGHLDYDGRHGVLGLKDVRLEPGVAEAAMVPMPLADRLHAHLLTSLAKQRDNLDWTAIEFDASDHIAQCQPCRSVAVHVAASLFLHPFSGFSHD